MDVERQLPMLYEVRAQVGELPGKTEVASLHFEGEQREAALRRMFTAILKVLDSAGIRLHVLDRDNVAGMERISFSVMATRRVHPECLLI